MKLHLGENIRENRRRLGLTQEQLADRLGVSFQSVSRWEKGATYPDMELLPEIARLFDTTIDALVGYGEKEDKSYAEVTAELENALRNGDKDETCRLMRLVRYEYREDFLRGDLLVYAKIHPVLNLNYTDILRIPEILAELRAFAEDFLANGADNIFRGQLITRMAELEDEQHIDDFIRKYMSNVDISEIELRRIWYRNHDMREKYMEYSMYKNFEHLRLFLCWECDGIKDPAVRLKMYEEKLGILNILSGIEPDENYPVSGNGEADVWSGVRYGIAFGYAAHLAACGQGEKAIRALEDTRDMIEKMLAMPNLTTLGCNSAMFGNMGLEMYVGWEAGVVFIETPRGEGEHPYKDVIPMSLVSIGNVPYLSLTKEPWHNSFVPIENDPRFQEILRWAEEKRIGEGIYMRYERN